MRRMLSVNQEDVLISFFRDDKHGNMEVAQVAFTVPKGTGEFALAAMGKGFVENFGRVTDGPDAGKELLEGYEQQLETFRKIVAKAMAATKAPVLELATPDAEERAAQAESIDPVFNQEII